MNNIECTFKLVYTCNVFTKVIDTSMSPYDLKNHITSNVNNQMGLIHFKIIIAGTELGENNIPLDCSIRNVNILSLVGKIYNNHIAFYIKQIDNNEINIDNYNIDYIDNYNIDYIINNRNINNEIQNSELDSSNNHSELDHDNNDCPICYTTFTSLQTIRFGCNHTFCRSCTANWFRTGVISCPLCRS